MYITIYSNVKKNEIWAETVTYDSLTESVCADASRVCPLSLYTWNVHNDVFDVLELSLKKIRCTENYLELHETKNIYETPINQGLIWDVFWYMLSRKILRDTHWKLFNYCIDW